MRIAVVGAGAEVSYLLRSDYEAIGRRGIKIRAQDSNFQLSEVNGFTETKLMGPADLVMVAVKATSNAELPNLLRPIVKEDTAILSLQNGLGNTEFLQRHFPDNPIFGAACYVCLNRVEPGVVENYHLGSVAIAEQGNRRPDLLKRIGELFSGARLKCRLSESIDRMRWEKLLWNAPFNGLSIVGGKLTTDEILANDGLRRLARGLMEELITAAGVLGWEIEYALIDKLFDITRNMGEYAPSSLLDFLEGREIEVEAIWGEPLRQALVAGLDMPKLETLYRLLRIACAPPSD